ncbi:MAG: SMP-30/gluconolactonase/LRE family protein [Caulobacteraceae bacterium]
MKQTAAFAILSVLSAPAWTPAAAQPTPAAAFPPCIPPQAAPNSATPAPQAAPPAAQTAPRNLAITAIPGVVAAGGAWKKLWQKAGNSADGALADKDGSVLIAAEDYDAVLRIKPDGTESVAVAGAKGIGSIAMDRQGRLYGLHRTERPGSTKPDRDTIINAVTQLTPDRKMIADKWSDGSTLSLRINDLVPDGRGGAYVTGACLYHTGSKGMVVLAENLRTNGVALSPDDKTLYVTNGPTVVAFDIAGPGALVNRRDFGKLEAGGSGDGMTVDTLGRLYVTSGPGVQVFDKTGKYLGLIPTPRSLITLTFAGPGKKTLYVVGSGADDANGQPIRQGPQATAATIYALPVLSQGLKDRAK